MTKVAIVTGSNKGLGKAIVTLLCEENYGTVYLTSRDEHRGLESCAELKSQGLRPAYHQLDVTDNASIKQFQDHIRNKHGDIDLLINNAGILFLKDSNEPFYYQAEKTLFVNYFSLVDFTEAMLPLMKNGGRIVNVSSSSGHLSRIPSTELREKIKNATTVEQLNELFHSYLENVKTESEKQEWGDSPYVVSKVGVNAYTFILHRKLRETGIAVNSVHPGYVMSDMTRFVGTVSPRQGALSCLLAAKLQCSGCYIWHNGVQVPWDGLDPRKYIDGRE